jgi:NAD(P)-dependent dehydrogenase (short-subunit alcohol dehydrogenase family)
MVAATPATTPSAATTAANSAATSATTPAPTPAASSAHGFDLHGKTAVVTGASSGLGRHFVEVLSQAGAQVFAVARRADLLADLAGTVPNTTAVRCDVTVNGDIEQLLDRVQPGDGRPVILVNSAGGATSQRAVDLAPAAFADAIAVNLTATFTLSAAFARSMIDGAGGSIINIASMYGLVAAAPIPHAAYTAAKSGVIGLTRQLGCEWARHGVRVNAIAPGWFPTDLTRDFLASEDGDSYIRRNTPIGRPGRLDELDGALLLLASDLGSYITGQTIVVDGGWTAR